MGAGVGIGRQAGFRFLCPRTCGFKPRPAHETYFSFMKERRRIMGMTNEQYKGMLLDELEQWQEVKKLAEEAEAPKLIEKAEQQIAKINEKLKF